MVAQIGGERLIAYRLAKLVNAGCRQVVSSVGAIFSAKLRRLTGMRLHFLVYVNVI